MCHHKQRVSPHPKHHNHSPKGKQWRSGRDVETVKETLTPHPPPHAELFLAVKKNNLPQLFFFKSDICVLDGGIVYVGHGHGHNHVCHVWKVQESATFFLQDNVY